MIVRRPIGRTANEGTKIKEGEKSSVITRKP
jgi:hypothetical protein